MMRALLLALALVAAPVIAQEWRPLDTTKQEAKLAEYIRYGWSKTQVIDGLKRWFGYNFEIPPGSNDVFIVLRRTNGEIYHFQKIGEISSD